MVSVALYKGITCVYITIIYIYIYMYMHILDEENQHVYQLKHMSGPKHLLILFQTIVCQRISRS